MKRRWDIWYWKQAHAVEALTGQLKPSIEDLSDTHMFLTHLQACHLEDVFKFMQADIWSPKGEARSIIEALDVGHTSMSVGDVAHDVVNDEWWMCDALGWTQLNKEEE